VVLLPVVNLANFTIMAKNTYKYVGDKIAKTGAHVGRTCTAVHRKDGKCIRGRNGNMLVDFSGKRVVVPAKHLRKIEAPEVPNTPEVLPRIFAEASTASAIREASGRVVDVLCTKYADILGGLVGRSQNTRKTYIRNVGGFIEYIAANGISAASYGAYREHLARVLGVAVSTKNARLAAAGALLREAYRVGVLPMDITAGVPVFKAAKGHVKDGLSAAEVSRVLGCIREKKNADTRVKLEAMFWLMAAEGLRQFEVQGLTAGDVDINGRCILFRGKGKDAKERFFITPQTADALARVLAICGGGYLFTNDANPSVPITLRAIRKHFTCPKYGIFARCGVSPGKSLHGFRHYNITATLEATGGDLAKTRRRSRHSSFSMLQVYDDARLQRADVDALASVFDFGG
jgi:integrase